ncbi:MAG: fucose isomerase [Clostridiales bacterium]|nr:fucose isomerase [Clostridiales bacterium]
MNNIPEIKVALTAVSRDCFPIELSQKRRQAVMKFAEEMKMPIVEIDTIIENENDVLIALGEIEASGANALCIFLGNFGPEGPETLLAQRFNGPVMFAAAAEETGEDLIGGRGDAYCGMLNASYNVGLRNLTPYIPEYPVGTAIEVAHMIYDFIEISRVVSGVRGLKIMSFGPRPHDFLACNAPIKPLYDLGVEIQENSELDLYASYNDHAGDPRISEVVADMAKELGHGNNYPDFLKKLAQYELTLEDWMDSNIGASENVVFANKCWPAFQTQFGFVPCYVNSRFSTRGIPISCEADIYGALSEYMLTLSTLRPSTLLDINNTVPKDMYDEHIKGTYPYSETDVFMGFHCGNTPSSLMKDPQMKYQLIMKRLLEPDSEPNISRGTLEGRIAPNPITMFRLQSTADSQLRSYIAEGEVLDVDPKSFGSIGVIGIKEMGRFYRHVLIQKRYPHHAGIGFAHKGRIMYEALKILGIKDIEFNRPKNYLYETENPFGTNF